MAAAAPSRPSPTPIVVLGRLDPDDFLGGGMQLDPRRPRTRSARLAGRLGLDVNEAAEGVLTIINSNMANAIRSRTVQKGIDPRGFALVAFGGAGPLHGAEVAAMLEIPEVIVPPYPGITSAMGLLTTDLKYDAIRTQFQVSGSVDLDRLNADFAAWRAELTAQFDGRPHRRRRVAFAARRRSPLRRPGLRAARCRFPAGGSTPRRSLKACWRRFHDAHAAEYGHAFAASPIEIVNIRVSGVGQIAEDRRA